jgi:hypothetical protein
VPENIIVTTGDFKAGQRAGKGIMLLPDGGVYTGDFVADKWEGKGMYEYPDGSCYVGDWQQGKKHGSGAAYPRSGLYLETQWTQLCYQVMW